MTSNVRWGQNAAANKELARDLAQFAVDGGTLVIGVAEHAGGQPATLAPVFLKGLAERIELIVRTVPDPPLAISCHVIKSATDPELGYVLATVPISRDCTSHDRWHLLRTRRQDQDPAQRQRSRSAPSSASGLRGCSSGVARSVRPARSGAGSRPEAAHVSRSRSSNNTATRDAARCCPRDRWFDTFNELKNAGLQLGLGAQYDRETFAPDLTGQAASADVQTAPRSPTAGSPRTDNSPDPYRGAPSREDAFELELSEDGAIRLMNTRLSDEERQSGEQKSCSPRRCPSPRTSGAEDRCSSSGPYPGTAVPGYSVSRPRGLPGWAPGPTTAGPGGTRWRAWLRTKASTAPPQAPYTTNWHRCREL